MAGACTSNSRSVQKSISPTLRHLLARQFAPGGNFVTCSMFSLIISLLTIVLMYKVVNSFLHFPHEDWQTWTLRQTHNYHFQNSEHLHKQLNIRDCKSLHTKFFGEFFSVALKNIDLSILAKTAEIHRKK